MNKIDELKLYYEKHKQEMDDFLRRCSEAGRSTDREELLRLLCRNILASQVKWEKAVGAVGYLSDKRLLFNGDEAATVGGLKDFGYRFPPRGGWLHSARRRFYDTGCEMDILDLVRVLGIKCENDPITMRNLLADASRDNHILGLGMKEASHFLRGLGFSHNRLAILDRVVIGRLVFYGVIEEKPKRLGRSTYLAIEREAIGWANDVVGIPIDGLDWLLWEMGRSADQPYVLRHDLGPMAEPDIFASTKHATVREGGEMNPKPSYFIATFGGEYEGVSPVDGDHYPYRGRHKAHGENLGIVEGDIMLLYCTGEYPGHEKEAPGVGIVTRTENDETSFTIYYRYLPLDLPVDRDVVNACLGEGEKKPFRYSGLLPTYWVFPVADASFRKILDGRQIVWP
jgi:thermostable 8-oxoguanine DNA glycosylase